MGALRSSLSNRLPSKWSEITFHAGWPWYHARMARQFKTLFCERYKCSPSEYEERAFRKCLYWHARLLAPVLRLLSPGLFSADFKFINYLGETAGGREASAEALDFQDANRAKPNFLRTGLKIRVSGQKAASLARRLFAEAHARERPKAEG